jgi:hypothetical protein
MIQSAARNADFFVLLYYMDIERIKNNILENRK